MQKIKHKEKLTWGGIAIATFLLGVGVTLFSPLRYTALVEPVIVEIDPSEALARVEADPQHYTLIDVRSNGDYTRLHAKGAINIPIHLLYDERKTLPRSDKTLMLMCTGGRLSGVAYSYLEHYGFRNIVRVEGGIEHWQEENLPVVMEDLFK
jgi:rhodanese-related sulfurtransferase